MARSIDIRDRKAKALTLLKQTLAPGETVSWSGGLRSDKVSSKEQGQNLSINYSQKIRVSDAIRLLCIPLYVMCFTQALMPGAFFSSVRFISLAGMIFFLILLLMIPTRTAKINNRECRHLLYALTDRSLRICVETGLDTIKEKNDSILQSDDRITEWTVELVDIPLYLITAATFYNASTDKRGNYLPVPFTERVELEVKIPIEGSLALTTNKLWLHGFSTADRLGLKTRLRSLGIQCYEGDVP